MLNRETIFSYKFDANVTFDLLSDWFHVARAFLGQYTVWYTLIHDADRMNGATFSPRGQKKKNGLKLWDFGKCHERVKQKYNI